MLRLVIATEAGQHKVMAFESLGILSNTLAPLSLQSIPACVLLASHDL